MNIQSVSITPAGPINLRSTVESPPSLPFVVITNEIQWEEVEELLLRKDCFMDNSEIPWYQLCNTLQRHFLRSTRQDPTRPDRYLSRLDFQYFHSKFFDSKDVINMEYFQRFWDWFGKSLQVMRYQRHIKEMWQEGLIYGYMSKEGVQDSLINQEPGVFIIRFSESQPGQFAIGYVGVMGDLKHYLASDVSTKKLLADFLAESCQFLTLLQCTGFSNNKPCFKKVPKLDALKNYCAAAKESPTTNRLKGYDPLENPWAAIPRNTMYSKRPKTGDKRGNDL